MPVRDYCDREPIVIAPEEPVREAAKKLERAGIGCLVVVDDERRPVGVVTDRDIALRSLRRRLDAEATPVSAIMSEDLSSVSAEVPLVLALRRMRRDGVRRIPVIDADDRLCGLLVWDDAIQVVSEELQGAAAVAKAQRPIAAPAA